MSEPHTPGEPDPTLRPARLALYAGVVCVVLGALALYAGYNGAATNPVVEAQVPYIISGGLAGLALLLLGGIGIAASVVLKVTGEIRIELHAAREAFTQSNRVTSSVAAAITPDAVAATSTNGYVIVSSTGSSYHRADCRLVERVEVPEKVPRGAAAAQGLHPCRVCNP
jgi:hypothetical protein